MNPGRGWNPDLEESYLREYSEYKDEIFTYGTSRIYIQPTNFLAPDPSPIFRYSKSLNMTSFSLLRFSSMNPNLQ